MVKKIKIKTQKTLYHFYPMSTLHQVAEKKNKTPVVLNNQYLEMIISKKYISYFGIVIHILLVMLLKFFVM